MILHVPHPIAGLQLVLIDLHLHIQVGLRRRLDAVSLPNLLLLLSEKVVLAASSFLGAAANQHMPGLLDGC